MSQKKCLQIPCIFLSFKGNIIWTCVVGPVMSPSVVFISFAKKVAIDFYYFFSQLLRISFSLKLWNETWGSLCPFKVAVYLQGCLMPKRCSASGLSGRYLNTYIKLKLIELAIKLYQEYWNEMNCWFFSGPLNVSALITFWKLQVKVKFVFCQFSFFPGLRTKSAKKECLHFAIFNCSKKLQNIF